MKRSLVMVHSVTTGLFDLGHVRHAHLRNVFIATFPGGGVLTTIPRLPFKNIDCSARGMRAVSFSEFFMFIFCLFAVTVVGFLDFCNESDGALLFLR